ncbi:MAG: hypothetical protein AAF449_06210, partial [Myxococcota bacterium]
MDSAERPTADAWRSKGQFTDLLGHRIFFVDGSKDSDGEDTRPVLLLLHGFPTSSWDWVDVW